MKLESNEDLIKDWFDEIFTIAGSTIRRTKSWEKYRQYYIKLLTAIQKKHCTDIKGKEGNRFCVHTLPIQFKMLDNMAIEHCKFKEDGCKQYCEKYCDHFSAMGAYYYPRCYDRIYDPALNGTKVLDPIQEDIEEYLNNFLAGKNCRE